LDGEYLGLLLVIHWWIVLVYDVLCSFKLSLGWKDLGSKKKKIMTEITLEFLITYSFFTYFLFYPTKWMKDFQGASQKIYLFLIYFSGLGTLIKLSILFFIFYKIDFENAIAVFLVSLVVTSVLVMIEPFITRKIFNWNYPIQYIGLVSIIVCPILAVRLFYLLKVF
jgi:hypothetical protein